MTAEGPNSRFEKPEEEKRKISPGLWLVGILMLFLGILLGVISATKALLP